MSINIGQLHQHQQRMQVKENLPILIPFTRHIYRKSASDGRLCMCASTTISQCERHACDQFPCNQMQVKQFVGQLECIYTLPAHPTLGLLGFLD